MQLRIVRETEYLRADLHGRETPEEMREAIWAILAECRRSGLSNVLISTRKSRPLFKVQEFGLSAFLQEMSTACKVALVAENQELRASDEYIATMAQQKSINVRAFRSETVAARRSPAAATSSTASCSPARPASPASMRYGRARSSSTTAALSAAPPSARG
jgi:hypothetical protein